MFISANNLHGPFCPATSFHMLTMACTHRARRGDGDVGGSLLSDGGSITNGRSRSLAPLVTKPDISSPPKHAEIVCSNVTPIAELAELGALSANLGVVMSWISIGTFFHSPSYATALNTSRLRYSIQGELIHLKIEIHRLA